MRKGHKRTQSATLNFTHSNDCPTEMLQGQGKAVRLEIPALLSKSSAKIKEKVCQVESLHVSLADFKDPLFTFGRGFMTKKHLQFPTTAKKPDLSAIPEGEEELRPRAWDKKPVVVELKSCKEVHVAQTGGRGNRVPFEEKTNKAIKENLSPTIKKEQQASKKTLQSAIHLDSKPPIKLRGHIKHASSLK